MAIQEKQIYKFCTKDVEAIGLPSQILSYFSAQIKRFLQNM